MNDFTYRRHFCWIYHEKQSAVGYIFCFDDFFSYRGMGDFDVHRDRMPEMVASVIHSIYLIVAFVNTRAGNHGYGNGSESTCIYLRMIRLGRQ